MISKLVSTIVVLALFACGATPELPDAHNFRPGEMQIAHRTGAMPFGPGPASVPFPTEMAVLEGSPNEVGLFTMRVRTEEPWLMPPHSHPRAERVTVIAGTIHVGFGRVVDRANGETFGPGDYYVNAAGAEHFVWVDGPVEFQITGLGPWEVHPVE